MSGIYKTLPVDLIDRSPYQVRLDFDPDELASLADSIQRWGVIQPIVVRPKSGRYELVAGENRWRAAGLLQWDEIPSLIRDVTDHDAQSIALAENINRADLSPIEKAIGFQRLITDQKLTQEEVALITSTERSTVSHFLRLLDLPDDVRDLLHKGDITVGHGKALLGLPSHSQQSVLARRIVQQQLNVRTIESEVDRLRQLDRRSKSLTSAREDPNIRVLRQRLQDTFLTSVQITQPKKTTSGSLTITWNNVDELQAILEKMGVTEEDAAKSVLKRPS